MLELAQEILSFLHGVMDVPPALILPVVLSVEGVAIFTRLKESESRFRNLLLGLICVAVALLVSFLTLEYGSTKELLNKGFVLGSVSALTYQIIKPVFKYLVEVMYARLVEKFGGEIKK
jgi:hypothetical protein